MTKRRTLRLDQTVQTVMAQLEHGGGKVSPLDKPTRKKLLDRIHTATFDYWMEEPKEAAEELANQERHKLKELSDRELLEVYVRQALPFGGIA